jgi:very-long-chain (3R)-3-hydroxyacyl-CoA dehydratase
MGALSNGYLAAYNLLQVGGWTYILVLMVKNFLAGGLYGLYTAELETTLEIFQSLAILEFMHSLFGIVKSNAVQTLGQVFSRNYILWIIVDPFKAVRPSPAVPLFLTAWTLTEIVRYSFYFLSLVGNPLYLFTYLRYTLFIVLYPMGVAGEMLAVFYAQPEILQRKAFSVQMPNQANMSFDFYSVTWAFQFLWPLGLFQLYTYMLRQRKKALGTTKDKSA